MTTWGFLTCAITSRVCRARAPVGGPRRDRWSHPARDDRICSRWGRWLHQKTLRDPYSLILRMARNFEPLFEPV